MDFRQETTGRVEAIFLTQEGELVPQPAGRPIVEILYISRDKTRITSAVIPTVMVELEPGHYFYDWIIPADHPTIEHQISYKGIIDDQVAIGEDTVTVLPAFPKCVFTPTTLTTTTIKGCGC